MTWVYLGILALTVVPAILRGRDLLSPVRIYVSIYSLLLALYSLNLSRLQTPWSQTTTMLFWGANFLYLAGAFLVYMVGRIKFPDWRFDFAAIKTGLVENARAVDWNWFNKVFLACSAVFILSYFGAAFIIGQIPILAEHPDKSRMLFFQASLLTNYGIFFGPLALMLSVEMLVFGNLDKARRNRVIAMAVFIFFLYMTIITRYDIFRFFLFAIVFYHYGRRNLGFLHLTLGFLALAAIFMVGFLVRVNTDAIEAFNEIIKIKLPKHLAWASNFYSYLANDFWNLDYAIRKFEDGTDHYPMQYGFGLFRGLLNTLHLEGPLIQMFGFDSIMNESIEKVKGLNTIVYVWYFYKDFGILGVFALTLLGSLAFNLYYANTMLKPTLLRLALWALFVPAVLLSYHAALWECWFWYFNMAGVMVAHRRLGLT